MVGPLFRVEMVATARQGRFFALRVLYGALILLAMWSAFETAGSFNRGFGGGQTTSIQASAARANAFFVAYTWLQTLAILAVAPAIASGTVATERERRTIEYLFVTDLSNREIILDKLLAKLAVVANFVALGLPILFLFRLMGGIASDMLLGSFIGAASLAVMLTGLGLFVSVCSQKPRDALVRVYLLIGVIVVLPGLVVALCAGLRQAGYGGVLLDIVETINGFFVMINPFVLGGLTTGTWMTTNLGFQWKEIALSAGGQFALGAAAALAAAALVRRVHLKETSRSVSVSKRKQLTGRRRGWPSSLGARPMLWKEMYSGTSQTKLGFMGQIAAALLIIGLLGTTLWVFLETVEQRQFRGTNANDNFFGYLLGVTGFVGSAILLLLGSRASGLVTLEKERDCWLSLIATPLTGKEIVQGKVLGNMYAARWMFAVLAACWAFGVAIDPAWLLVALATSAVLAILSWYVSQVGVGYSLRSSTTLRSNLITVGTLMLAGGGYLFCCCAIAVGGAGGEEMILGLCACIPMLIAYPGMAYQFFTQEWGGDEFAYFSLAFGLGIFGYFAAGATIGLNNQRDFDRIAGRVSGRPFKAQEPVAASAGGPAGGSAEAPPGM
ncbi:MAG: ABC transporter permease [Planctomycetota bacterium]